MNGKLIYVILGVMFTINMALVGAVYSTVAGNISKIGEEQARRTSRIATLESQVNFNEGNQRDLKAQLTRIEGEVIALRILAASSRDRK